MVRRLPGGALRLDDPLGGTGAKPDLLLRGLVDYSQSGPVGKSAGGDWERFDSPAAQAALTQFEGTNDPATQQQALNGLQGIMSAQAPVIPLVYGAAWYEYSTKKYTGWPTQSDHTRTRCRTRRTWNTRSCT